MVLKRVVVLAWTLALVGCASQAGSRPVLTRTCAVDGRERPADTPDGVDYFNFIWHDGRLYSADFEQPANPPAFGEQIGEVTCRFSGSKTPVDYGASREGEAGFLDKGTPYYSVRGVPISQVIAAEFRGRRLMFKVALEG